MRTQDLLLTFSCITYSSVNSINHVVCCKANIYFIIESLCLLITFIQFLLPFTTASGNHKSDLFFYEFVYLFGCGFFEVWLTYHTMLFPGVQHSDSVILYITKWSVTMLSLVTICHHAKILPCYWLYPSLCTFSSWDLFILQLEVCNS